MSEAGTRLRADARRNRARVLDAAQTLLATEGLSVPIEEISRLAGVGIGTVYRHFPTKEALFEAVVVDRVERLVGEARARAADEDAGAAFFGLLRFWAEAALANKAFVDGMVDAGFDVKAATKSVKQEFEDVVASLLVRAQEAGAVRDDVIIGDVMLLLTGTCLGVSHAGADAGRLDRSLSVLFDGLRPAPGRLPQGRAPRNR